MSLSGDEEDTSYCSTSSDRLVAQLEAKLRRVSEEKESVMAEYANFQLQVGKFFSPDQLRAVQRGGDMRGIPWTSSTIKTALQIRFACGTAGYNLLRKQHQPLPGLRTIQRKMSTIPFQPGVLHHIFEALATKVEHMQPNENLCCLTLEEMSITAGYEYDPSTSQIAGTVNLPGHSGQATHGLVFMLSGLTSRWKQVAAYFLTGNKTDGSIFKQIVLEIIDKATKIGLHVSAVTSDMGSSNRAMWSSFGLVTNRKSNITTIPHPSDSSRHLHFLADVPHVIKNLRSALCSGNEIELPLDVMQSNQLTSCKVNCSPVLNLIEYQEKAAIKLAPNVSRSTIHPSHFEKMKVSGVLHLFSNSVSSGIRYLVAHEGRSADYLTTAWFLEVCNKWFDLMSSRHPVMALSKENPEKYQAAVSFLRFVIKLFAEIKIGEKGHWKPVQTGVIMATTSVLHLQEELLDRGLKFLLTARLTQDCAENLFSMIRQKDPIPKSLAFQRALKAVCVNQFLKLPNRNTNYNDDDFEIFTDLFDEASTEPGESEQDQDTAEQPEDVPELHVRMSHGADEKIPDTLNQGEQNGLYYILGYCIFILKKTKAVCSTCLTEVEEVGLAEPFDSALLLSLKEYKEGSLSKVTGKVFTMMLQVELMFRSREKLSIINGKNIKSEFIEDALKLPEVIKTILPECHNLKRKLLSKYFNVRVSIFCREINCKGSSKGSSKDRSELGSRSATMRNLIKKLSKNTSARRD